MFFLEQKKQYSLLFSMWWSTKKWRSQNMLT